MINYDNITLVPRVVSSLTSRSEADTSVEFCGLKLGVPFVTEDDDKGEGYLLIVDDICDTGETLKSYTPYEYILTATIHHKQSAIVKPDFYYSLIPENRWIVYPWENPDSDTIPDYLTRPII
jgi:hypothetical protein